MTLDYFEHPDATAELLDTVRYYETQRPGLGEEFHVASLSAIDDILDARFSWPKVSYWEEEMPEVRRRKISGFPYQAVYILRGDTIVILAYAHEKRRPGYWSARVAD